MHILRLPLAVTVPRLVAIPAACWLTLAAILPAWIGGCGDRDAVQHYRLPSRSALWAENHVDRDTRKPEEDTASKPVVDRLRGSSLMRPQNTPSASDLVFEKPEKWVAAITDTFSLLAFSVTEGSATARVTISQLQGDGGGLLQNVNRWRVQVNLPGLTEADLANQTEPFSVSDIQGVYLDCVGTNAQGGAEGVSGWIGLAAGRSWFVKIRGEAALVASQRDTLRKFLQTLKFNASQGASDGK